jgi:uncharacterized membrane protein YphA (DoxX/SURF4 family)
VTIDAGYLCALVLAAVFVWAGAAKLARPTMTAAGFGALGLPAPGTFAVAVPVVELLLSVTLVAAPRAGSATALVLLAVFTAVLAHALRAGATSGCACFGTTATRPLSRRDLVRNAALAALALGGLLA